MPAVHRVKTLLRKPENVILLCLLIILTYLILLPLFSIVGDTFPTSVTLPPLRTDSIADLIVDRKTFNETTLTIHCNL